MLFPLKVNLVRLIVSVAVLVGMIGTVPVRPAYAAPLLVSNTSDSGPGSLRQAILDAVSGDTITFAPALAGGTILLNSQLTLSEDLTIDGSALDPRVTLSGQSASRIMEIIFNAQVTISSLVFTQGVSTKGGAIHATGNAQLKLENSTFHQNQASLSGGAISVEGNSTGAIVNSTFSQNQAGGSGGAISIVENGNYTIIHSTLVDNSASGDGGAVAGLNVRLISSTLSRNSSGGSGGGVSGVKLEIDSTTIDQNHASFSGGAIALGGNTISTIVNSTVTENQANSSGGAISINGNPYLQLWNSTFAANHAPAGTEVRAIGNGTVALANTILACLPGDQGCIVQSGNTLISGPNSIIAAGTLASFGLAELADNGGPTQTMALLSGSPLIDAGDDAVCANSSVNHVDPRGVTRPQGSHCDIGAYERQFLIRYVKQDATAPNDGSSWAHAHTDLQSALAAAAPDEEIWVAAGTYKPTSTADRTISFTLKNGVALYGGFAGTEISRTQRNYQANVTILSGDIGAQGDHSDNSYHVVVGSGTNNSAVLDGFTVAYGKTNDGLGASPENMGGGMYNQNGDPSVSNVIFTGNQATFGGGMYNGGDSGQPQSGSHPLLTNLTFQNNTGIEGGGMRNENYSSPILTDVVFDGNVATRIGAGMENISSSNPVLMNVTFTNNIAMDFNGMGAGGGMANILSNPNLTNVIFVNNSAQWGGGMLNGHSSPSLTNVSFHNNSATTYGGGIANEGNSNPTLTHVTMNGNSAATFGGAIYNDGGLVTITDSSFTGNSISGPNAKSGGAIANYAGTLTVTDSLFAANSAVINPYFVGIGEGGAIYNQSHLTVAESTFSENEASRGGAIGCSTGIFSVTNSSFVSNHALSEVGGDGGAIYDSCASSISESTFSTNSAAHHGGALLTDYDAYSIEFTNNTLYENTAASGGGIANYGRLLVMLSTFSHNHSSNGGAIRNGLGGILSLYNDILANSLGGADCIKSDSTPDIDLVGTLIESTGIGLESCGMPALSADPLLGPLQDNGGPTKTMALSAGSPAIDAGSDAHCLAADQRGVTRPQGSHCDIGAYEYQDTTVPVVLSMVRTTASPTSAPSVQFAVTFSEPVTNVDTNDFAPQSTGGITGAAVTNVSGSGSLYIVTVNTGSGNGTLRLDLPASATITGLDTNPLGSLPFTGGEVYSVLKTASFSDVGSSYWAWSFIERLYLSGITKGCSATPAQYCPEATVTRAQMAVFLERGIHGSSYAPPSVGASTGFGDVPINYWSAAWIKQLATDGITSGCGGGNYCPEESVTRAQMAVFLLRAQHGATYTPPALGGTTGFGDVPLDHWAAAWIKQLAAEGITGGCGGGNYCPDAPVTRAQMAVFLVRTFNLP